MCSTVHTESKPAASAAFPSMAAPGPPENGPVLANMIPNFIAVLLV